MVDAVILCPRPPFKVRPLALAAGRAPPGIPQLPRAPGLTPCPAHIPWLTISKTQDDPVSGWHPAFVRLCPCSYSSVISSIPHYLQKRRIFKSFVHDKEPKLWWFFSCLLEQVICNEFLMAFSSLYCLWGSGEGLQRWDISNKSGMPLCWMSVSHGHHLIWQNVHLA